MHAWHVTWNPMLLKVCWKHVAVSQICSMQHEDGTSIVHYFLHCNGKEIGAGIFSISPVFTRNGIHWEVPSGNQTIRI